MRLPSALFQKGNTQEDADQNIPYSAEEHHL
jgi:hypothetical protein